jgi:hypothetical protein
VKIVLGTNLFLHLSTTFFQLAVGALNYFGCWLFTSDAAVAAAVQGSTAAVMVSTAVHAGMCGSEGVLCALRDFRWLFSAYLALSSLFFVGVRWVRLTERGAGVGAGALAGPGGGLRAIWLGFAAFNVLRSALFSARVRALLAQAQRSVGALRPERELQD